MSFKELFSDLRGGQSVASLVAGKGTTVEAAQSAMLSLLESISSKVSGGTVKAGQNRFLDELQQSISSGNWVTELEQLRLLGTAKKVK
jgi:hypothetical protein